MLTFSFLIDAFYDPVSSKDQWLWDQFKDWRLQGKEFRAHPHPLPHSTPAVCITSSQAEKKRSSCVIPALIAVGLIGFLGSSQLHLLMLPSPRLAGKLILLFILTQRESPAGTCAGRGQGLLGCEQVEKHRTSSGTPASPAQCQECSVGCSSLLVC